MLSATSPGCPRGVRGVTRDGGARGAALDGGGRHGSGPARELSPDQTTPCGSTGITLPMLC